MILKYFKYIIEGRIIDNVPKSENEPHIIRYDKYKKGIKNNNFNIYIKNDEKNGLNYTEKVLQKTNVRCLFLYDFNSKYFKYLKFGEKIKTKNVNNVIVDKESMNLLEQDTCLYLSEVIKENIPDVDYIISPESSSSINTNITYGMLKYLKNINVKILDKFFIKDVYNITYIKEIGNDLIERGIILPTEIETFRNKIKKWKTIDEPIRDLLQEEKRLLDEISKIPNEKIDEKTDLYRIVSKIIQKINDLKGRGKSAAMQNFEIKPWSLKSVNSLYRQLITNLFKINTDYIDLVGEFKNNKFVIFDDVYTTGKTVNECCLTLLSIGVKSENILVITLGKITPNLNKK